MQGCTGNKEKEILIMRIQHNIMAMNANRNLTMNNSSLAKNLEKLSSGYRINRAGDDAAGLAISEKMRAAISVYDQSINNANDGISMVQTAEGALTEVHSMLNRMVTLATQAANGTYDTTATKGDTAKIKAEVDALITEIDRIASTTKFNGITLLDNSLAKDIVVGESTSDKINITISTAMTSAGLGLSTNVSSNIVAGGTTAQGAIATIKTAIDTVSKVRSDLGAIQNRLEHTVNNLGVTMENLQNAESTIRDTNVADEMMKYTKNNILIQSAQAMLAQANQVPQGVLQLMQ
jgi:flagellin